MPKNKLEEVVLTFIMATCMVYGMIVYNIALNTGVVRGITFAAATHELIIMMPIAFVLELFVVGQDRGEADVFGDASDRPAAVYHVYDVGLHLQHHVPDHEPNRDVFI